MCIIYNISTSISLAIIHLKIKSTCMLMIVIYNIGIIQGISNNTYIKRIYFVWLYLYMCDKGWSQGVNSTHVQYNRHQQKQRQVFLILLNKVINLHTMNKNHKLHWFDGQRITRTKFIKKKSIHTRHCSQVKRSNVQFLNKFTIYMIILIIILYLCKSNLKISDTHLNTITLYLFESFFVDVDYIFINFLIFWLLFYFWLSIQIQHFANFFIINNL